MCKDIEMRNQNITPGYIGIAAGSIAFMLALVHFWAGPFTPQPTLEQTVAEKAVAIKKATIAALKGENTEPAMKNKMNTDKLLDLVTAVLGGLAIILGVISFARADPIRIAGGAAILGGAALAFQFVILAIGAIVLAIVIAAVLSQLDIS